MWIFPLRSSITPVSYTHLDVYKRQTFDTPALGNAQPLYPDTIDYAPLENNAEFLIYEGANAVGKGLSLIHI